MNSKGPTKGEQKLASKIESLKSQIEEKDSKYIVRLEKKMSTSTTTFIHLFQTFLETKDELTKQSAEVINELSEQKGRNQKQDNVIQKLLEELKQKDVVIERITNELRESNSNARSAEQQYDGLKNNVNRLQENNECLTKSNDELVKRIVQEKEKYMEQIFKMNENEARLNQKIEMLLTLKEQEKKRFTWTSKKPSEDLSDPTGTQSSGRQFGAGGVIVPSNVKHRIAAHTSQITCVRYDSAGGDVIATASEGGLKMFSTGNGKLINSFRGGSGQVMLGLDVCGDLIAGSSTDKTCRVWNTRKQRLVHQLVGHSQKVIAVRLLKGNAQAVLTASTDRSMKVWDISRSTYRQNVTLRHSSTSTCLDTSYDSVTVVSGHLDGGVRFFDIRSSERTGEVSELHSGGVTSVNFNPNNNSEILSAGRDDTLKIVDVRQTGQTLQTFNHPDFRIDLSYAACAISPDGKYAAAGSSTGDVFVWRIIDGKLEKQLNGHDTGVVGIAWDRGGSNGQQFASVDKKGNLFLWA